jgi:hypothetical protein
MKRTESRWLHALLPLLILALFLLFCALLSEPWFQGIWWHGLFLWASATPILILIAFLDMRSAPVP